MVHFIKKISHFLLCSANLKKWRELADKEALEKEKEKQREKQTEETQDEVIKEPPVTKPSDDVNVTSEKSTLLPADVLDDSASDTSFLAADKPLPDPPSGRTSNTSVPSEKTVLSSQSEESR